MSMYKYTFPLLLWKDEEDHGKGLIGGTFVWNVKEGTPDEKYFDQCLKVSFLDSITEEYNRYSKKLSK